MSSPLSSLDVHPTRARLLAFLGLPSAHCQRSRQITYHCYRKSTRIYRRMPTRSPFIRCPPFYAPTMWLKPMVTYKPISLSLTNGYEITLRSHIRPATHSSCGPRQSSPRVLNSSYRLVLNAHMVAIHGLSRTRLAATRVPKSYCPSHGGRPSARGSPRLRWTSCRGMINEQQE